MNWYNKFSQQQEDYLSYFTIGHKNNKCNNYIWIWNEPRLIIRPVINNDTTHINSKMQGEFKGRAEICDNYKKVSIVNNGMDVPDDLIMKLKDKFGDDINIHYF